MSKPYPVPENEAERNAALLTYRIMDSPPEILFNEIGELAAQICCCPVAYVSFIHEDRFWFKAKYGLPDDFTGCPREIAFCSLTVAGTELVMARDLAVDERYREFHFVVNEPHFRFYAAVPLITPEGYALGTICVMDFVPKELTIEHQETLRRLAQQVVSMLEHRRRIIELDEAMRSLDEAHRMITAEKEVSDSILERILPAQVSEELKAKGKVEPRYYPAATILFADIKDFTRFTEHSEPRMLIGLLDRYFAAFDEEVSSLGVDRLKTVGDAYIAVSGVPNSDRLHVLKACLAALAIVEVTNRIRVERTRLRLPFFELRIGIHTGAVIAGTIGKQRFAFDVWGDAINVAARIESVGEPGRISVSEQVFYYVKQYFEFIDRGMIELKSKGPTKLYFLDRLKAEFSSDASGLRANDRLAELTRAKTGHEAVGDK